MQLAQQLHFPLGQFAQMVQLAWGAGARGHELQGGLAGQAGLVVADESARVDGGERTGGEVFADLPGSDPVALRDGDGVRLPRHRNTSLGGGTSTARSSSRTRSNRSASETSDSFFPLTRWPGSAVSGPGLRRSLTVR